MISRQFLLAGRATFTVSIPEAFATAHGIAEHYTYRVTHKPPHGTFGECFMVAVLTGTNNTEDFSYLGMLTPVNGQVRLTGKSRFNAESYPYRVASRVLARIWAGDEDAIRAAGWDVFHAGRCGRCGRMLTTPESVFRGLGPECASRNEYPI